MRLGRYATLAGLLTICFVTESRAEIVISNSRTSLRLDETTGDLSGIDTLIGNVSLAGSGPLCTATFVDDGPVESSAVFDWGNGLYSVRFVSASHGNVWITISVVPTFAYFDIAVEGISGVAPEEIESVQFLHVDVEKAVTAR